VRGAGHDAGANRRAQIGTTVQGPAIIPNAAFVEGHAEFR